MGGVWEHVQDYCVHCYLQVRTQMQRGGTLGSCCGSLRELHTLWPHPLNPPSASYSVLFWALMFPLILLISSWSSTFLLFSLVWTSILPPSFHTSDSSPPPSIPASSHKAKHMRSQESNSYWLFPYPETQKYKIITNRGGREDLPQHTHLGSFSPSRAWSWPGEGRSWTLLKVPRACKDCVWPKINNQL